MHHVEIVATPECGHCRHVTDVVTDAVIALGADAEVHGIDATAHPEVARTYGFLESPIVIVDGEVVARGAAPPERVLRELLKG